jgi:hypothetical protein
MTSPLTPDEIAALAVVLADKTTLGSTCTNMELRGAIELLNQRGYLRRPPPDHPTARRSDPATRSTP